MKHRRSLSPHTLLLAIAAALVAASLSAQAIPGVGYDPASRGLRESHYTLDRLGTAIRSHRMDFSADPGAVGQSPNPYYLNLGDPAVRAAFEARYGPDTVGPRFKSWVGPNDEVRFVVRDALIWWFANRPAELGVGPAGRNGIPTEVEITDVQATGDSAIWITYLTATGEGYSPERPRQINDPSKPPGDSQAVDPFWGIPVYYRNAFAGYPFSPQWPMAPQ